MYLTGDYTTATPAGDPWVFTGSLTNNSGIPLVWAETTPGDSSTYTWSPDPITGNSGGGSGYAIKSGACAINTATGTGGYTDSVTGAGTPYADSTDILCNFASVSGGIGVPVTQVQGFQLSVTGNNSDTNGSTSETLGNSTPSSKTPVEPTPGP